MLQFSEMIFVACKGACYLRQASIVDAASVNVSLCNAGVSYMFKFFSHYCGTHQDVHEQKHLIFPG